VKPLHPERVFSYLLQIKFIRANLALIAEVKMRKSIALLSLLPVLVLFLFPSLSYPFTLTLNNSPTQVYFGPHGGAAEAREIINCPSFFL
jgi:hypothetical protein